MVRKPIYTAVFAVMVGEFERAMQLVIRSRPVHAVAVSQEKLRRMSFDKAEEETAYRLRWNKKPIDGVLEMQ